MSRWHQASCTAPNIIINGESPHCRSCGIDFCLEKLTSQGPVTPSAPPPIPENEPPGQLNLRWPPSVPYTWAASPPGDQTCLSDKVVEDNLSLIYNDKLTREEVRLARLDPSGNDSSPVHISLETHILANSLEYDSVSYMWGGENGDYTPCRPVFVGPYWDVLLQTQNCWSMLKVVRLQQGSRLIWVDAVCINQQDDIERGEQVANMRKIYEQCVQVVVYLGPDLATPATNNVVPRRRLHELEASTGALTASSPILLRDILERKYFSRVWVIQELVLSQRAIFRIGGCDFWADSRTSNNLSSAWSWDSTAAMWVQFMAKKALPLKNILEVTHVASRSHASDPRDKLFGVLGLYQHDGPREALLPDYSVSVQHVFIGFFAYCLINLRQLHLLYRAAGLAGPKSSPSWVPNWETDWPQIFTTPSVDSDELIAHLRKHLGHENFSCLQPDSTAPGWKDRSPFSCPKWADDLYHRRPWFQNVSVRRDTGALSLYLTHICVISRQPSLIGSIGSAGMFEVLGTLSRLFLISESALDTVIDSKHDHLFMLNAGNSKLFYIILRQLDDHPKTYKMVAACMHVFMAYQGITPTTSLAINTIAVGVAVIRATLDRTMAEYDMGGISAFFPSAETGWDTLPAYRGIHGAKDHTSPVFQAAYLACIDPLYRPRINDGFIELTFTSMPKNWGDDNRGAFRSGPQLPGMEFVKVPYLTPGRGFAIEGWWEKRSWGRWIRFRTLKSYALPSALNHTHMRAPLSLAWNVMHIWFRLVTRVHRILGCSIEELEALLRSGVVDDDRYYLLGCPPAELEEDFRADGHTYQVQIL